MLLGGFSTVITIFVLHLHHNQLSQRVVGRRTKLVCRHLARCMFMSPVLTDTVNDEANITQDETSSNGQPDKGHCLLDHHALEKEDAVLENDSRHLQYLNTLKQIRDDMADIRLKSEAEEQQYRIHGEWKAIALIIDRFSFWVCLALLFTVSLVIGAKINSTREN